MSVAEDNRSKNAKMPALADYDINWSRVLATVGVFVVLGAVMAGYYRQNYSGLNTRDQMDIAQIARNIVYGGGFTTRFIRPLNIGLMRDESTPLPEINHGPVYPYLVAVAFKAVGISEQAITWVSMAFGFLTLFGAYLLGRTLFDWRTGIFAAASMGVSTFVLQVTTTANEWPVSALLFVLLMLTIAVHHKSTLQRGGRVGSSCTILAGLLIALLYMTCHVLLMLAIPTAIYFAVTGSRRKLHFMFFVLAVIIAVAPWAYRNAKLTDGSILAANAWDLMVNTRESPGDTFYRSMDGANRGIAGVLMFPLEHFFSFSQKLMDGTSEAASNFVAILGLIILPLSVVSMLYRFKSPSANAVRGVAYGFVLVLVVCIALFSLGHNALLIIAPAAAVFGSAYLFLLLDAKKLHPIFYKGVLIGVMLISSWPALSAIAWGSRAQTDTMFEASAIMSHGDRLGVACMYTDVPWLAAWRTEHQVAVWLPRTDRDISRLILDGYSMNVIVLTPESRNYPTDELWHKLYTSKIQREYIANPDKVLERVRTYAKDIGRSPEQAEAAKKFFQQNQRNAEVFDSIKGYKQSDLGAFASDDLQIYQPGF